MRNSKRVVIAASEILDGKGGVLHDTRILIEGSKIVAIDAKAGPADYDLRGLTVLPGWIDAHVHITCSFGPDGRNVGEGTTIWRAGLSKVPHIEPVIGERQWNTKAALWKQSLDYGVSTMRIELAKRYVSDDISFVGGWDLDKTLMPTSATWKGG